VANAGAQQPKKRQLRSQKTDLTHLTRPDMSIENDIDIREIAAEGVWLSISDLAELKGKSRQTVWEKVKKLEADGHLATRSGPGGTRQVDVAEYDRLVGETTDFARQQAAATRAANADELPIGAPTVDPEYNDGQRKKVHYEARLKALEFGRQTGQLVSIVSVKRDVEKIFTACIGSLDSLVLRAEEATAAALNDGIPGVRQVLADAAFKIRAAIAAALRDVEAASRAEDGDGVDVALDETDSEPSP
jgi:hypothetical protein